MKHDFFTSVFSREEALSRRDALAGLGLIGALLAAPSVFSPSPAAAKALDKPIEPAAGALPEAKAGAEQQKIEEAAADLDAADGADLTDLSARRRWWRRRWRRHWRRRYWRHRYYRRRRWWRRRWRRRYWY